MGMGFCRYDMTTAEMESMKLLMICLVSSLYLVLAKLMQEQYTATQPHLDRSDRGIALVKTS